MSTKVTTPWDRLPVHLRAGTPIDWSLSPERLKYIKEDGSPGTYGTLARAQGFYQCGGELGNYVYWRLGIVSIPLSVWEKIYGRCRRIECVDHTHNECYSLSAEEFFNNLVEYEAGIGPRVGVDLDLWHVSGPQNGPSPDEARQKVKRNVRFKRGPVSYQPHHIWQECICACGCKRRNLYMGGVEVRCTACKTKNH